MLFVTYFWVRIGYETLFYFINSSCFSLNIEMNTEDTQQFCLRWHNYQSSLLSTLPQLLDGDDLTDVTLCAGSRNIKAHRVVLSACSEYFKELFRVSYSNIISLAWCFNCCIMYIAVCCIIYWFTMVNSHQIMHCMVECFNTRYAMLYTSHFLFNILSFHVIKMLILNRNVRWIRCSSCFKYTKFDQI